MKVIKSINFDNEVLDKLKERAKKENTTVSNLVNMVCRQQILSDFNYFRSQAKHHFIQFQKFKYMQEIFWQSKNKRKSSYF